MANRNIFGFAPFLAIALFASLAHAQLRGTLTTSDIAVDLAAGTEAPQLQRLRSHGEPQWVNTLPEALPISVAHDGERIALKWHLIRRLSAARPGRVAFVYESRQPHLRLTWEWLARARFGPLEHRVIIENLSGGEYWLTPMDSLRLQWLVPARTQLLQFYVDKGGGEPTATGTHEVSAPAGYAWTGWSTTFAHPVPGRAREIIPYEAVYEPQEGGSGWYAGIEFSGRTRLTLRRAGDHLNSVLGLDPEPGPVVTRLAPRAKFATPTVFLGAFSGGSDGAGNQLRPWVRAVLGSAQTWRNPDYPFIVNNSWGVGMDIDAAAVKKMIADAAALGFEMYHLDAGWFRGVGDWYPDPRKFPQGLVPLAEDAHQHGMKFGLWVDWAQAGIDREPGALDLRDPKVRNWLVADVPAHWQPQDFKGQTVDLGVPAAKAYAQAEVNRIVTDYHLDMLEHDGYLVAQGCTRKDHPHAPPDPQRMSVGHYDGEDIVLSANSTDVSYHAVRAYYDIYEQLRRRHPGLLLEICNDGGRMVDFGSAAHGDYFSITDTYTPLANRRAFYDASFVLPPAMLEAYEARWPTPGIGNFLYMLRSGMMGWLTVMQDTSEWTAEQHAAARKAIALYKTRLRPLIRDAELFHISARPDGVHWDGMEYWDPARGQGMIFAFHGSDPAETAHRFRLSGLNARATYHLHCEDGTSPDATASGQQLMTSGLRVVLREALSSELIFLSAHLPSSKSAASAGPA
ncbi:MAG TPA: alpha-galactosidase [Steroidobacteraceae bacterium]|nr:alpha-galactosidase [Steroidobacteraceae bacterium]